MSVSNRVVGGNSPAWLAPALMGLGVMAWLGAGVSAASADTDGTQSQSQSQTPTPTAPSDDDAIVVVDEEQPADAAPTPPAPTQPTGAPQAPVPQGPCAPAVELTFAVGESAVDAEGLQTMAKIAADHPDKKIVVEGYASAAGAAGANLKLSHRRAQKAKTKLVAEGVDASRITVQAFGEYRPNLGGDEDRDRRVVMRIEGMATCPDPDTDQAVEE